MQHVDDESGTWHVYDASSKIEDGWPAMCEVLIPFDHMVALAEAALADHGVRLGAVDLHAQRAVDRRQMANLT
jgi:hypothetical protein